MNAYTGLRVGAVAGLALLLAGPAWAGGLEGRGRIEKIKGKPQMGYLELYESNLFLSPAGPGVLGPSRRLGTTHLSGNSCIIDTVGTGEYCIDGMPEGTYSILVNQPIFFIAPKVLSNVAVPAAGLANLNFDLGIDYSTSYKNDWTNVANSTWYQTFTATGTGIRGVAFSFAGNVPMYMLVAVLQDNGNSDVRTWPALAERADYSVDDITDNWVRFRSAETPTVPGQRYAIRLTGIGASFQPYKRNKDSFSYFGGRAYDASGVAQNFDMNITVFSDNDGTSVTMNKRTESGGALIDGYFASKWGHTFVARGSSLAAVDVWAAGANHEWNLDFTWKVFPATDPTGPTGAQISPTKTTQAAFQAFGMGLHGVSYNPNQVRLVPGQSYFIEFAANTPPPDSPGFNPYVMDDDSYDEGMGYQWTGSNWQARPDVDLAMTILEYKPLPPSLVVDPETIDKRSFYTGNPPPSTFNVLNGGNGTIRFQARSNTSWMSVNPTSGSCNEDGATVTISFTTASMARGNYIGTITVTSPDLPSASKTVTVNLLVDTVSPDFDGDTDVDEADFGLMQACLSGAGSPQTAPQCARMRLDRDDDVDPSDVEIFLDCFKGPNVLANPYCTTP